MCLIPTTIGALISAIGIAGMDRLVQHNVLAMSGRAVEAAGDVDTLLLDKTGTITLGNRQATEFLPLPGVDRARTGRRGAAGVARRRDARGPIDRRARQGEVRHSRARAGGQDGDVRAVHGADAHVRRQPRRPRDSQGRRRRHREVRDRQRRRRRRRSCRRWSSGIARAGGTPLVVAERTRALGVIHLKDIVKGGMRERFDALRAMGIQTVMITGDNPLTAAAIAREAGVDDFLAEATPEDKMALIRREQAAGKLVAMTGDGTNDAPALAQADVGVAMNTGTTAAKEAGNMVDLDSNPTKLIEIVEIGKQLLMTRGALTTFSIANDVAKYFAIIPAMFILAFPQLGVLNVMRLATPESAILSAVIFNAVIIIALIPLALRGIAYRPLGAAAILRRNMLIYGVGGVCCRSSASRPSTCCSWPSGWPDESRESRCRDAATDGRRAAGADQGAGPAAAARLHRRRARRRQDLRDAARGARPARARPRRRRRPRRDLRPQGHRGADRRPRGRAAPEGRVSRHDAGGDGRRRHHPRASRRSASSTSWRTRTCRAAATTKRYQDVLEILDAGIHVMTAVNIQHLETLNDAVARVTGVRVRETVPDTFLDRADEVINVDVTVEELRNRLREGKVYRPEKVEQALDELLPQGQSLDAARAGAARRRRRSRREGRQLSRARGPRAGADSRARDGLHELEPDGAARHPHRRAHRRPARREVVRRVRRDAQGAAGPDPARDVRRRSTRTSGSPRASAPRSSGSGPIGRPRA